MPKKTGAQPRGRRLGQHFLFDKGILERIADTARVEAGDNVLEVGPGQGTLTEVLAGRAGRVAAVELDGALMPKLTERMAPFPHVKLIHADIMKVDLRAIWRDVFLEKPFKVVANLPYYITTPVIMLLLESGLPMQSMTVLVQKEVADRLASPPGSRTYGSVSVAVQYRAEVQKAFHVPAGAFSPPPNVESAVLHMAIWDNPPVLVVDEMLFERVVRGCFHSRRKTLRNNISSTFAIDGSESARILEAAGLDPNSRAEQLGLRQFAGLANKLSEEGFASKQNAGV